MSTKPFPPDLTTHPTVTAAREALRDRHRSAVSEAKAQYDTRLEQRWEDAEKARKAAWIAKERYDNPPRRLPYPWASLNDAGIVRVAATPEDRLRVLGECFTATRDTDFLVEMLTTYLYRRSSKAPLADVKAFLKEVIEVHGTEELYTESTSRHYVIPGAVGRGQHVSKIEHYVIADGLSAELASVLRSFKIKSGVVYFVTGVEFEDRPGLPVERWTFAHQDEEYDTIEF
jgi:hypothetical protein